MKKRFSNHTILFVCISIALFFIHVDYIAAFQVITAQEAFDMLQSGQAKLIDVRTLEECAFVGSPSLEPGGDPAGYLVPFKLFNGIDENGNKKFTANSDFNALIDQTFGNDKNQHLIVMCGCGIRSTSAAEKLEQLGYSNIYEIDNKLKEITNYPGANGGLQGSTYNNQYDGYRGYPGRLNGMNGINVETNSNAITNENDSVSWMDTGLPITEKMNPDRIPKLKKESSGEQTSSGSNPQAFFSLTNPYQFQFFSPQQFPAASGYYQPSSTGMTFPATSRSYSTTTSFTLPGATQFSYTSPFISNTFFNTSFLSPVQSPSLFTFFSSQLKESSGCGG